MSTSMTLGARGISFEDLGRDPPVRVEHHTLVIGGWVTADLGGFVGPGFFLHRPGSNQAPDYQPGRHRQHVSDHKIMELARGVREGWTVANGGLCRSQVFLDQRAQDVARLRSCGASCRAGGLEIQDGLSEVPKMDLFSL